MADAVNSFLCRVASNAAENEMDAHALALSLAPCVAWHAPPQSERRRVSHSCHHPCTYSSACTLFVMQLLVFGDARHMSQSVNTHGAKHGMLRDVRCFALALLILQETQMH